MERHTKVQMQIVWTFLWHEKPKGYQAQRRGSQIEVESCLTSHPRELESNLLPPRRRWLLSCHSPHSYQNARGNLWNMCISQRCWALPCWLPLQPQWGHGQNEQEQWNNNTWFSHILLRLVGTMRRKQEKATFHFSGWKIDFRCTRKSRKVLQTKQKLKEKKISQGAWNVSYGQKLHFYS